MKALPAARPLISVPELAGLLNSERPPALLDVRWRLGGPAGIEFYQAAHLPGAVFIDLDSALAGPPGSGAGGRHPLPERGVFEAAMRAAGLNEGQLAVAYDDAGATIAARLWWLLRYFGHDRVAVLDGGLAAWTAAGQPVTTDAPRPERGSFTAGPGGGMPVLDEAGAARLGRAGPAARREGRRAIQRPGRTCRSRGGSHSRRAQRSGDGQRQRRQHVPAAGQLRARFAGLGLPITGAGDRAADPGVTAGPRPEPLVGAYCGSGVTAAQEVLALELAGLQAALYVGSWSAWSARPGAAGCDRRGSWLNPLLPAGRCAWVMTGRRAQVVPAGQDEPGHGAGHQCGTGRPWPARTPTVAAAAATMTRTASRRLRPRPRIAPTVARMARICRRGAPDGHAVRDLARSPRPARASPRPKLVRSSV